MTKTARDLCIASLSAIKAGDRAGWLALYADDAVVEDPVGKSPLDPTGKGHRGKEAIGAFYDNVIAHNKSFDFRIDRSFLCGDEVANLATFTITFPNGETREMDLIINYRVNGAGRIASLRAFWEFSQAALQARRV